MTEKTKGISHQISFSAAKDKRNSVRLEKFCAVRQMRVLDMHAHLSVFSEMYAKRLVRSARERGESVEAQQLGMYELDFRKNAGIATCLSSGTPQEWEALQPFLDRKELFFSFGIHPWYAACYEPLRFRELFEQCDLIGEIGMDSVWCDVPLNCQKRNLEQQLQIAADLKKPVVLHTKGQEEEIAAMLKGFPYPVLIHWYSGSLETFEKFRDLDCYFTLGPDLSVDAPLYRKMLKETEVNRLFVETDGLSAIAWAKQTEFLDFSFLPLILEQNMALAAKEKCTTAEALQIQMTENLRQFLVSV